MIRQTYRLALISSSHMLVETAKEVARELGEELEFSSKGLEDAISVGKEMEASGVEVIISRGGTSYILRENLCIPVLSVPLSSFDILKSVRKAAKLASNIVLATFGKPMEGLHIFEELFNVRVFQAVYVDSVSLEREVLRARDCGCEVLIGGGVSMRLAARYGLKGVELETSRDVIASMIGDAKSVARARREQREKAQRYQCIIDSASEGIIAVDRDGNITTVNRAACGITGVGPEGLIGNPISKTFPESKVHWAMSTGNSVVNRIEEIAGELFMANHVPILLEDQVVGGVSTYRHVSAVIKAENEVRRSFSKGLVAKYSIDDFVHKTPVMRALVRRAVRYAGSDSTIILLGETGTGKEILAHSIHNLSKRSKGPFVSINCAALPEQLLESELFGYEEGAFTGSKKGGKPGLFEIAHKGTIFLDEIGATPLSVQARLLRVVQEKEVMRIGGERVVPVDVRIIAATNRDLVREVKEGRFREDLFFRLNVLNIHIPPLRQRKEDIPLLTRTLVRRAAKKCGKVPVDVPQKFVAKLMEYWWPGNVRQLEGFLEKMVLLMDSEFDPDVFEELYEELMSFSPTERTEAPPGGEDCREEAFRRIREQERKAILKAMEEAGFCKTKAARRLGISRTTLWRRLKRGGLGPHQEH